MNYIAVSRYASKFHLRHFAPLINDLPHVRCSIAGRHLVQKFRLVGVETYLIKIDIQLLLFYSLFWLSYSFQLHKDTMCSHAP